MSDLSRTQSPWSWVPTLYFAQGLPYVVAMSVSVMMYKRLGVSNTAIALYTSWLYLPWVIKPLWSPVVEMYRNKRFWIVGLQFVIGASLACVALTLPTSHFFQITLAIFWLMAFSSATHDIAADGFYMLGLEEHQQAAFVGVRSTFYRVSMITGQGLLVVLVGFLEKLAPDRLAHAWAIGLGILAATFLALAVYHTFMLPKPAADVTARRDESRDVLGDFFGVFGAFFTKPGIGLTLAFMLLYRFNEAQLIKMIQPFLLDARDQGGLGLSTSQVGAAYGGFGVVGLLLGGITGGYLISRFGLRFWLWRMALIIHIPDLVYIWLSHTQPTRFGVIVGVVAIEQFSYGFGFTAYMLYMIHVAQGQHKTAHYAICTGLMALGMMVPGMFSGWLQDHLGYRHFFLWVLVSLVPGLIVASLIRIDPSFGKKKSPTAVPCRQCGFNLEGNVSGICPKCETPLIACDHCGYNLKDNVSGTCPECGTPVVAAAAR